MVTYPSIKKIVVILGAIGLIGFFLMVIAFIPFSEGNWTIQNFSDSFTSGELIENCDCFVWLYVDFAWVAFGSSQVNHSGFEEYVFSGLEEREGKLVQDYNITSLFFRITSDGHIIDLWKSGEIIFSVQVNGTLLIDGSPFVILPNNRLSQEDFGWTWRN